MAVPTSTRGQLWDLAAELGIDDRFSYHGPLDAPGLKGFFSGLHALVVPSVWEEPAGLVLVEGALAGVPLVASRVGGIPEIVRDPEEALLVPPGDPAALAAALRRTLTEPEGVRGPRRAGERAGAGLSDRPLPKSDGRVHRKGGESRPD